MTLEKDAYRINKRIERINKRMSKIKNLSNELINELKSLENEVREILPQIPSTETRTKLTNKELFFIAILCHGTQASREEISMWFKKHSIHYFNFKQVSKWLKTDQDILSRDNNTYKINSLIRLFSEKLRNRNMYDIIYNFLRDSNPSSITNIVKVLIKEYLNMQGGAIHITRDFYQFLERDLGLIETSKLRMLLIEYVPRAIIQLENENVIGVDEGHDGIVIDSKIVAYIYLKRNTHSQDL